MTQLDRIEIKLDAILNLLATGSPKASDAKTVIAEGQALGWSPDEILTEFNARKAAIKNEKIMQNEDSDLVGQPEVGPKRQAPSSLGTNESLRSKSDESAIIESLNELSSQLKIIEKQLDLLLNPGRRISIKDAAAQLREARARRDKKAIKRIQAQLNGEA